MVSQAQKIELSEADWIENESINRLMKSRRGTIAFASLASIVMATQLIGHMNDVLVVGWLVASLFLLFFRFNVKNKLIHDLHSASVAVKSAFVKKYSFIWSLNALIWGSASWLFLATVPVQNQYICATILNGVGFVAVLNLNSHRKIAGQYINTLMGTYVVACLWQIGVVENFDSPLIQYAHLISLLFIWLFLHLLDNRNYAAYKNNLMLLYRNNLLIHSLNLKTEQLESEKQSAINANLEIQRFYSSVARDIHRPVNALKISAELAMQDETKVPELLPKMRDSSNEIEALLSSLSDFSTAKTDTKIKAATATVAVVEATVKVTDEVTSSITTAANSAANIARVKTKIANAAKTRAKDVDINIDDFVSTNAIHTKPRILTVDFDLS